MKKHFKLYKSGKKWVTAAVVSFVAITGLSLGVAHADTNNDVVSSPEMANAVKSDVANTVATPSNVKTNDGQSDKTVSSDSMDESTIISHAAQQTVQNGWAKNDSGQWTYYTNGQVQTGRSYSYLPTVGSNQGHNWYLVDNGVVQSNVQPWAGSYYYFDPATYLRVDNDYRQSQ